MSGAGQRKGCCQDQERGSDRVNFERAEYSVYPRETAKRSSGEARKNAGQDQKGVMGFMFMVAFTGLLGRFGKDRQALPVRQACRCADVPSHDGLGCYVASRMSGRASLRVAYVRRQTDTATDRHAGFAASIGVTPAASRRVAAQGLQRPCALANRQQLRPGSLFNGLMPSYPPFKIVHQ